MLAANGGDYCTRNAVGTSRRRIDAASLSITRDDRPIYFTALSAVRQKGGAAVKQIGRSSRVFDSDEAIDASLVKFLPRSACDVAAVRRPIHDRLTIGEKDPRPGARCRRRLAELSEKIFTETSS